MHAVTRSLLAWLFALSACTVIEAPAEWEAPSAVTGDASAVDASARCRSLRPLEFGSVSAVAADVGVDAGFVIADGSVSDALSDTVGSIVSVVVVLAGVSSTFASDAPFDLGSEHEQDFATCTHCVFLQSDCETTRNGLECQTTYRPVSGSIRIRRMPGSTLGDPLWIELGNVEFVRVEGTVEYGVLPRIPEDCITLRHATFRGTVAAFSSGRCGPGSEVLCAIRDSASERAVP